MASRNRGLNNGLLLLLLIIPGIFFYFGGNMALWRYEQRALAEPIVGEVIEAQRHSYECKNSEGSSTTCTEYSFTVAFEFSGDRMQRPLLEVNFEPDGGRFSSDEVDPDVYGAGAKIPLLLRRDLGTAVAPDLFWAAFLIPTVLLGFGTFVLIMISVAIMVFWHRAPKG